MRHTWRWFGTIDKVRDAAQAGARGIVTNVTAPWFAYLLGADEVNDPRAAELLAAAAESRARGTRSAPFFAVDGLIPPALVAASGWRARIDAHLSAAIEAAIGRVSPDDVIG
ncbi:MAG TPA: hypothetical protein VLA00_05845 [Xanthobacteraceae bacterium]|nr:hypothetical protein [Xanthobacteraceae bacterium]